MPSFTAPNYDYDLEQADIARRQKLADAMQAGTLAPMDMPSTPGAKASPLGIIAKVMQAYLSQKQAGGLKDERQALTNRYQADGRAGLEKLVNGMSAQPGMQPAVGSPDGGAGANNPSAYVAPTMASPQDAAMTRRKAIVEAMGSGHPMLQQLGASQFNQLGNNVMNQKDWLALAQNYDPSSVVAAQQANDPTLLKSKVTSHVVNNQLVTEQGGKNPTNIGDFRDKFGPVGTVAEAAGGAPVIGQTNTGTGEAKFAPPGTQIHNYPPMPQTAGAEFAKEIAKKRAEVLSASYDKVKELPQKLATLNEASNALGAGLHSGQLADYSLAFSKVGEQLGLGKTDPAIANTEQFRANMASSVLDILQKMRPASNEDQKFALQAGGGDLKLAAESMQRLINSARATAYNSFIQHERLLQSNTGATGALPQDLSTFRVPFEFQADPAIFDQKNGVFNLKAPAAGAAAGPVSLDDYLKRHQK